MQQKKAKWVSSCRYTKEPGGFGKLKIVQFDQGMGCMEKIVMDESMGRLVKLCLLLPYL